MSATDRAAGRANADNLRFRGTRLVAPMHEFVPYVYGAATKRHRHARVALQRAEAIHGPRPMTIRGLNPPKPNPERVEDHHGAAEPANRAPDQG